MADFDQFKDKAENLAEQAKGALGKRNKPAGAQRPEQAERGMRREGQEVRPGAEGQAPQRMGRDEDDSQDDWA